MEHGFADHNTDRPGKGLRLLLAFIAAGMVSIFVIAVWLKPDPRGFGTHQQLGLPPCQFRTLTGFSCPHCGMTTSFSNIVRGDFDAAWNANPLGILLASALVICIPWCIATAVTGRWIATQEPFRWFVFGTISYLTLALAVWILRVVI